MHHHKLNSLAGNPAASTGKGTKLSIIKMINCSIRLPCREKEKVNRSSEDLTGDIVYCLLFKQTQILTIIPYDVEELI